jgi:predicted nucleotide-binding protein
MAKMPPTSEPDTTLRVPREDARAQIQDRIDQGGTLFAKVTGDGKPEIEAYKVWNAFNSQLLRKLFSDGAIQTEYDHAHGASKIAQNQLAVINNYRKTAEAKVTALRAILGRLQLFDEPAATAVAAPTPTRSASANEVFVVHGHDTELKVAVARMIEGLGLKATILHEQPNQGRTIIEKLEAHSINAAYAIVLLTPDDIGYAKDKPAEAKLRARQNVVLELGLFVGLIGRAKVCALVKGTLERPSDIDGVLYIEVDDRGSWKFSLANEMKAAGLDVDLNRVK